MKVGILSDTHNTLVGIDGAIEIFSRNQVELIVHCGDWTTVETVRYFAEQARRSGIAVAGVLGNNDRAIDEFLDLAATFTDFKLAEGVFRFNVAGKRAAAYHGHHQPTLRRLLTEDVDLLCLGHSHKPRYDRIDTKAIVNPGSTAFSIPRSRGWRPSVAIYDSMSGEAAFEYF